jgi:hypothetical protein
MVNQVRSRPNHYELLGLAPAAESAEIHRAFVAKMSSFGAHSIEEAAQFLVAYETLRDREKRRSYDASLGLLAKPAPREWSIAVTPPRWTPFMVKVPTNRPPEPQVSLDQSREVPDEPAAAPPAVQSEAKEPSAPQPAARHEAQPQERAQKAPHEDLEAVLKHIRDVGRAERERMRHADSAPSDWRRVGLALGGLLVGAAILGTMAGLSVQDKSGAAQAEPARAPTERAPKEEMVLGPAAPTSTAASAMPATEELPQPMAPVLKKGHSLFREHSARQRMAQSAAAESAPLQNRAPEGAALGPDPQPDPGIAADLPVSTKLIARTIERIGYRCGDVSSAAPAEGNAQGVYRITCSSGQTYQATPVRGRYHFRRLGN